MTGIRSRLQADNALGTFKKCIRQKVDKILLLEVSLFEHNLCQLSFSVFKKIDGCCTYPSVGNMKASLQRRPHISTEVNRTLCWGAQAVYFFCEKVYDSTMIETNNPEKPVFMHHLAPLQ
ncbi:hypothetical protein [Planococcus sp. CP5-4_UN]|uniref:hypothetical protein n=1 Tax=Planococcus sp. CP5-4_UN TaxID=2850852 RepID=UPI001C2C7055|nr:hypothetical protein [Planococcus sp. CP5-4_UN]